MSAEALLSRLDGVRRTGRDRWLARCPAHEDRTPSLSVRELDDGRVLVHDHAGCKVEDILGAVGLDFPALFPPRPLGHAKPQRRPWSAADVVMALEHELTVALMYLSAVHEGREITDREGAGECRRRIVRFIEELRHAA